MRPDEVRSLLVDGELLERYAQLIAGYGANIQPGQQVLVIASPAAAPLVRAIAAASTTAGRSSSIRGGSTRT